MMIGPKKNFPAVLLGLMLSMAAGAETDGRIEPDEYPLSSEFADGAYTLHWRVENDTAFFAMRARTTGWVALGIDPRTVMDQADMIFGRVESGSTTMTDAFSTGMFGPHPEDGELGGTADVSRGAGTEEDGFTTIEFERALTTGDRFDKPLTTGSEINMIWAYGQSDDWTEIHAGAGSFTVRLEAGAAAGTQSAVSRSLLILVHAVFLGTGFLLMASGIAIARYYRTQKWWLKRHKPIGVTAAVFSLIGVVTAWMMVEFTTQVHFRVLHSLFGAATILLIIATPVLGQLIFSKSPHKQTFRTYHRWSGRLTLSLMLVTILLGMAQAGLFT